MDARACAGHCSSQDNAAPTANHSHSQANQPSAHFPTASCWNLATGTHRPLHKVQVLASQNTRSQSRSDPRLHHDFNSNPKHMHRASRDGLGWNAMAHKSVCSRPNSHHSRRHHASPPRKLNLLPTEEHRHSNSHVFNCQTYGALLQIHVCVCRHSLHIRTGCRKRILDHQCSLYPSLQHYPLASLESLIVKTIVIDCQENCH